MAYRIYSRPDLRWRLDTDIFVAPDQFERLQQLLAVRGYTPALQHDGPLVSQQVSMIKNGKQGGNICIDLHREISNNTLFGNILSGELLGRNTVSLAQLHPNARCPSNLWLLLHALIHRVDHHNNDDRLLWLYDIHLLTTSGEFKQKLELLMRWIGRYQIISIALAGLQLTHDYFPNNNLLQGIRQLQKSSSTVPEPSAAYLQKRSRGETLRLSLRNTPGSAGKIRLLLQHAFPSLAYMKEKYHFDNDLLAPWYYGKRLLLAIGKLGHLQP